MLESPQYSTNLINQEETNYKFHPNVSGDDFPPVPTTGQQHEQECSSSNTTTTTASMPDSGAVQNTTRKIRNRKESITRGTASSLAKMVRPPLQHYHTTQNDSQATRNWSPRLAKKQSLVPVSNKHLYPYNNTLAQRRSSWTPLVQQQHQQQHRQRMLYVGAAAADSPSPSLPSLQCARKASNNDLQQQQMKRPTLHTPKYSSSNVHYLQQSRTPQHSVKNDLYYISDFSSSNTNENNSSHDSNCIINAPNHRAYQFPANTTGHLHSHGQFLSDNETTTGFVGHNTYKQTISTKPSYHECSAVHHTQQQQQQQSSPPSTGGRKGGDNAACCTAARHHQQQNSSFETPPPCFAPHLPVTVAGHTAAAATSTKETTYATSTEPCHPHPELSHHQHFKDGEERTTEAASVLNGEENLPSYMRRPICAACNRNVKVASSSETTINSAQQLQQSVSNSNSSVSSGSRSSSVSVSANPKQRRKTNRVKTGASATTAAPFSTTSSTGSIRSDSSSIGGRGHKHTTANVDKRGGGTQSPTSPIPTLAQHLQKKTKKTTLPTIMNTTTASSNSLQRYKAITAPEIASKDDRWKYLLAQQQVLLTTLLRDETDPEEDDKTKNKMNQLLLYLSNSNNNNSNRMKSEHHDTILLETQIKILQKLTHLVQARPSSIPQCFSLKMPTSYLNNTTARGNQQEVEDTAAMITRRPDHFQQQQLTTSWQTKIEYGLAKFRWGMSQWLGNLVGTGAIGNQAYDSLGYPGSITITGVCVTTEPDVLPQSLQKYYHPDRHPNGAAICYKYVFQLTRELRLTRFQLNLLNWVNDEEASSCEFHTTTTSLGVSKMKYCSVKFGVFHRRHHCRCCGHVFCQMHSCNRLPLFATSGNDHGEWARVCDACFFSRIEVIE